MQREGKLSCGKWQNWYSSPGHKPGFILQCLCQKGHLVTRLKKTFWSSLGIYVNLVQKLHSVFPLYVSSAAAAAKLLQSCPTLCDPTNDSPPGSPVPGILQARTLEWAAISFSNAWKWKVKVKSLSHVWLLATPWTVVHQAPPSMGFSRQECWSGVHHLLRSHALIADKDTLHTWWDLHCCSFFLDHKVIHFILWCNMTEMASASTARHLFRACLLLVFSNSFQSVKLWRKTKLPGPRP